jgi:hypothetical protein
MVEKQEKTEEFKISGDKVVEKVKELIKEGNARRIIINNENSTYRKNTCF